MFWLSPHLSKLNLHVSNLIPDRIWASHSSGYEEYYLLRYNAAQAVESLLTFQKNMLPPSSVIESAEQEPVCHLHSQWFLAQLTLWLRRWRRHVPLKCWSSFSGLHRTSVCHLHSQRFLAQLTLRLWRWRRHVPLKCQSSFSGLHGIISQMIVLFLIPDVLELGGTAQHLLLPFILFLFPVQQS
jgi:hypothetical protein